MGICSKIVSFWTSLKAPVIFDGRNLYDPAMVGRFGFTYYAIGRGKSLA